jgi:hypothetical protein
MNAKPDDKSVRKKRPARQALSPSSDDLNPRTVFDFYRLFSVGPTGSRPARWILERIPDWEILEQGCLILTGHREICADTVDYFMLWLREVCAVKDAFGLPLPTAVNFLRERLPQLVVRQAEPAAPGERPSDLIATKVAVARFSVSRTTLKRHVALGTLKSYRPPNAAKNAEHLFRESDLQSRFGRK